MKHTAEKITTVAALAAALKPDVVLRVPPDLLEPDPDQPRNDFPKDALKELADDIKRRGIEDPIQVRSDGERILIKHGERRWRAAQLAKLPEVPVLLAAPDAAKAPELERAFDQALHNQHHQPLSPMDWARFLRKLVDVHKLAVKDIPDELAKRGITMSRPYVSNLMRLTELPDWAAALLNQGALTASDAKHLLMAKPWPPAMKNLEQGLTRKAKSLDAEENEKLNVREWDVGRAYGETAITLSDTYGENAPRFAWQTSCKACPKRQKVNGNDYCLDKKCFNEKQEAAAVKSKVKAKAEKTRTGKDTKPKKPAGPTTINPKKVNAEGVVHVGGLGHDKHRFLREARFEPAVHCAGCEFNKPAVQHKDNAPSPCCFNVPHFEELQRSGNREEGVAQWLDERLLPLVLAKLPGNDHLLFSLLAWMALDAPTQTEDSDRVESFLSSEQHKVRRRLNLRTPGDVFRVYQEGNLNTEAIAAAGVRALLRARGHFYAFARYLKIPLTPAIAHLDREYLELKRKGELIAMLHTAGFTEIRIDDNKRPGAPGEATEVRAVDKLKLDELVEACLTPPVVEAVGVPPDVKALYENLSPKLETIEEHDDRGDLLDEDEEERPDAEQDTGEDTNVESDLPSDEALAEIEEEEQE